MLIFTYRRNSLVNITTDKHLWEFFVNIIWLIESWYSIGWIFQICVWSGSYTIDWKPHGKKYNTELYSKNNLQNSYYLHNILWKCVLIQQLFLQHSCLTMLLVFQSYTCDVSVRDNLISIDAQKLHRNIYFASLWTRKHCDHC